jgi:hypothetical protein
MQRDVGLSMNEEIKFDFSYCEKKRKSGQESKKIY